MKSSGCFPLEYMSAKRKKPVQVAFDFDSDMVDLVELVEDTSDDPDIVDSDLIVEVDRRKCFYCDSPPDGWSAAHEVMCCESCCRSVPYEQL